MSNLTGRRMRVKPLPGLWILVSADLDALTGRLVICKVPTPPFSSRVRRILCATVLLSIFFYPLMRSFIIVVEAIFGFRPKITDRPFRIFHRRRELAAVELYAAHGRQDEVYRIMFDRSKRYLAEPRYNGIDSVLLGC